RQKIARFCNVPADSVIENINAWSIYDVPFLLSKEHLDLVVMMKLRLPIKRELKLDRWRDFVSKLKNPQDEVRIGLVGKYVELHDAYLSIAESLNIAGPSNDLKVNIEWIHSEDVTSENAKRLLKDLDGILVAPGFGERGIEGKIIAAQYAREKHVPFLGICLGMQLAVVEFGRNVLEFKDCSSTEFRPDTANPVIDLMEGQKAVTQLGGSMRLGAYDCHLKRGSKVQQIYGKLKISERHRHRWEYNDSYRKQYEAAGMLITGTNPETGLAEIVELKEHPFYIGVQFHPEYKSTVENPHPLFVAFVKAAKDKKGD
ncbi:MAG: CTP synthase, partial [Methylococcales bacterium]|nr:CTP synthase [Methylococcales bacterium]